MTILVCLVLEAFCGTHFRYSAIFSLARSLCFPENSPKSEVCNFVTLPILVGRLDHFSSSFGAYPDVAPERV